MTSKIKATDDGTINATLGKKLDKVVTLTGLELNAGPKFLGSEYKEITFNIVPSKLYLYIDHIEPHKKLTITDKMSMEADMFAVWAQTEGAVDTDTFEIWLWK